MWPEPKTPGKQNLNVNISPNRLYLKSINEWVNTVHVCVLSCVWLFGSHAFSLSIPFKDLAITFQEPRVVLSLDKINFLQHI